MVRKDTDAPPTIHHSPFTISIVLVAPQMGENIGAAARAMANFGLSDLRIVAPRDGWPNPAADAMAAHGLPIVQNAQLFPTVEAAIADRQHVAATSARPRDMIKPAFSVKEWLNNQLPITNHQLPATAILFGRENSGLTNDELALADCILHIPVQEAHPSINLGHAVAIMCYELSAISGLPSASNPQETLATKAEIQHFFTHLETELEQRNFFLVKDKKQKMLQNIRAIFSRSQLTGQEIRTLRGIITTLTKR